MSTYTGGDKAGADITLANNDIISGVWTNIGSLVIPLGATVKVAPYTGTPGNETALDGYIDITAKNILIAGILDASGKGYGGGGGGGAGNFQTTQANGGAGIGGGHDGNPAAAGGSEFPNGGHGGLGGGTNGGAYGAGAAFVSNQAGANGSPGLKGGYKGTGINGDSSIDESMLKGGGGGGAGAGAGGEVILYTAVGSGGGGGGAGNPGGGYVKLHAHDSLVITGSVLAKGLSASEGNGVAGVAASGITLGNGGDGGAANTSGNSAGGIGATGYGGTNSGGSGGLGGPGSGGGVLLKCYSSFGIIVSGTIDTRGGGSDMVNAGSLKCFYQSGRINFTGATLHTNYNDLGNSVAAVGTITSDNTNVADGATVTIDAKTYTFKTTLTPTEGQVHIGTNADASLLNLIRAINHTGTPNTDYKCAAAHPTVTAASSVTDHAFAITAITAGVAGNSIVFSDTSAHLSEDGSGYLGGTTTGRDETGVYYHGDNVMQASLIN